MNTDTLYRLSAFADIASDSPATGNPAGVWIGDCLPDSATMQRIASEVGYSETAFLAPTSGLQRQVRYFSPLAEVPFCGHATIAAAVALGRINGEGDYAFQTSVGEIVVTVSRGATGFEATLISVDSKHEPAKDALLERALGILGWQSSELDPAISPAKAFAGAWHLIIAVREASRLDALTYDFELLKALMREYDLTTLQLVWRESDALFHSRNPFPVGGVVEDPATGAAAAAFGGYLRDANLMQTPGHFIIRQGKAMGRPSLINVNVPVTGGIHISGTARDIDG